MNNHHRKIGRLLLKKIHHALSLVNSMSIKGQKLRDKTICPIALREPRFPVYGNLPSFSFANLVQLSCSYAYSDEMGEESDDEAQSLCRGSPKGDIGLVKQDRKEKNLDSDDVFNPEDEMEEDKRE